MMNLICKVFKMSEVWKQLIFKLRQIIPNIYWEFMMCEAKSFAWIISFTSCHAPVRRVFCYFYFTDKTEV